MKSELSGCPANAMAFNGWRNAQQILTGRVYSKEFPLILIVKTEREKVLPLNRNSC